jgi:hypothetical protein
MAEATAATAANPGMDRYNRYYNTVLAQLQQDMGPERSDSQLKNYLTRLIRPSYDQAIAQRQQQTGQANAMIDTDAASRGMGTSTWVTDAKNRQRNNEANDIATLNSNYASTLYDALLNQLQQRDQNRLALMGQAQGITGNMYDRWKAEDDALAARAAGGSGGGGGEGSSPGRPRGGGGGENPPAGDGFGDDLLKPATKWDGLVPTTETVSSKVDPTTGKYLVGTTSSRPSAITGGTIHMTAAAAKEYDEQQKKAAQQQAAYDAYKAQRAAAQQAQQAKKLATNKNTPRTER